MISDARSSEASACYGRDVEPALTNGRVKRRGKLFRKYVVPFVAVVTAALVAKALIEVYFSYLENKAALVALQQEKAQAAAGLVEAEDAGELTLKGFHRPVPAANVIGLRG